MQILLLDSKQLQFVHCEVELPSAIEATLLTPQLIDHIRLPGALYGPSAAAVKPLTELFSNGGGVTNHLNAVEVVLRLSAATDDPGGLA